MKNKTYINILFILSVDSGKTGYVVDKKRIEEIREQYGKKYPDFLGKDEKRSYRSESIVGKLYRNARNYINGKTDDLENLFAQLNLDDDDEHQPVDCSLSMTPSSFSITVNRLISK